MHRVRERKRWSAGALELTWAIGWMVGCVGCSAVVDPDIGRLGRPPPPTCELGTVINCACIGGLSGRQICNEGGTFNACNCTPGIAGASGSTLPAKNR